MMLHRNLIRIVFFLGVSHSFFGAQAAEMSDASSIEEHSLLNLLSNAEMIQDTDGNRSIVSPETLLHKPIFLYFSAHWCSPCRAFTPQFAKVYEERKAAGKPITVIFVSLDRNRDEFENYFKTMPWIAANFEKRASYRSAYEVQSIPTLMIIGKNGNILTRDASPLILEYDADEMDEMLNR